MTKLHALIPAIPRQIQVKLKGKFKLTKGLLKHIYRYKNDKSSLFIILKMLIEYESIKRQSHVPMPFTSHSF